MGYMDKNEESTDEVLVTNLGGGETPKGNFFMIAELDKSWTGCCDNEKAVAHIHSIFGYKKSGRC